MHPPRVPGAGSGPHGPAENFPFFFSSSFSSFFFFFFLFLFYFFLFFFLNLITQAISLKEKQGKRERKKKNPALPFILRIMEFAPFLQRVNSLTKTT